MEQRAEIAVVMREAVDVADGLELRLEGAVAGDERGDRLVTMAVEDLLDPVETELLDLGAGLAAEPGLVGPEPRVQFVPAGLREHRVFTQQRGNGHLLEREERGGPRGVGP